MRAVVRRLPLRVRLVAAFAAVMLGLLTAAGAFVYWRVQVALDRTLSGELRESQATVVAAWQGRHDPAAAVAALPADVLGQVLDPSGRSLAQTPAATGLALLRPADLRAVRGTVDVTRGNVLTSGSARLRVRVTALAADGRQPPRFAAVAVRLGQRDEALRELLAQLAAANLLALAAASLVGHRLARAALAPVERYRARAQQITDGATGLRLDVPAGVDDELSRLGHTLNQMLAAQEQAAASQRQFLADASHELRSPLTVLSSEVELALRRPRSAEEHQRTLEQVALDTARLVALADQLLDLEGSGRAGGPATADVLLAAERAATRARGRSTDPARTVTVHGPPGPLPVGLDETALDQVLGNLVDNAVVHGEGDISLTVRAGEVAAVTVSDEGAGPPLAFVAHAVERFRRADEARTTPGNGLGLSLVHAIVSDAGGELRLCAGSLHHTYPPAPFASAGCSHPAAGTHVTVLLPIA